MAVSNGRLAGSANITIDGVAYLLVGDLEYNASSNTRESLTGMDGYHGFSEKPKPGAIAGTFRDQGTISVDTLFQSTGVSMVVELNNGKTIIGSNMTPVGEGADVKSSEGTFEMRWEGPSVSELLGS